MRKITLILSAFVLAVLAHVAHAACSNGTIAKDTELLHGTMFIPLTDRLGGTIATPRPPGWFVDTAHRPFAIHAGARRAGGGDTQMKVHHYTARSDLAVRVCKDRDEFKSDIGYIGPDVDRSIAESFCASTTKKGYQLNEDAVRDEPEYILCDPAGDLNVGSVDTLPITVTSDYITITDGGDEYRLNRHDLVDFQKTK